MNYFSNLEIELQENMSEPLPASRHVALRGQGRHRKPKADWSMTSGETKMFVTIYIATMCLVLVAVVLLAVI